MTICFISVVSIYLLLLTRSGVLNVLAQILQQMSALRQSWKKKWFAFVLIVFNNSYIMIKIKRLEYAPESMVPSKYLESRKGWEIFSLTYFLWEGSGGNVFFSLSKRYQVKPFNVCNNYGTSDQYCLSYRTANTWKRLPHIVRIFFKLTKYSYI